MGVAAHDVTTTFPRSSTVATAATFRTGGRGRTRSTRRRGKRRRRERVACRHEIQFAPQKSLNARGDFGLGGHTNAQLDECEAEP